MLPSKTPLRKCPVDKRLTRVLLTLGDSRAHFQSVHSCPNTSARVEGGIVRALSHLSTHEYFHVFVNVASFWLGHVSHLSSLFGRPSRYPRTSCPNYLRCRAALTSLIASNLFWYARPCPTDIRLTDGTLPILTFALVGAMLEERQIVSWRAALHNPQLPWIRDDCPVTIVQSSLQGPT